jgi:8-oxo-dGTP diphosphatase
MSHDPQPHADGRFHGVAVAVRGEDGKYLLIRRSGQVRSPLKVCFPGGTIEPGETQEAAVVREMWEELGVRVRPVKQVWRWDFDDKPWTLWGWVAEMEAGGTLAINREEVEEVLWLTPEEAGLHPDALPTNVHFLKCLRRD